MRYRTKNRTLAIAGVSLYITSFLAQITMCFAILDKQVGMTLVFAALSSLTMIAGTALMLLYVVTITNQRIRNVERWSEPIG